MGSSLLKARTNGCKESAESGKMIVDLGSGDSFERPAGCGRTGTMVHVKASTELGPGKYGEIAIKRIPESS